MNPQVLRATILASCIATLGLNACSSPGEAGTGVDDSALASENGLSSINGLSSLNGLSSINGLSSLNGLSSINGLASTVGLMTTSDGRKTVEYLVRCALPAGSSLVKQDQYGNSYTFKGGLGFAPEWATSACGTKCQEYVSACMMAHINTAAMHVPLWIVAAPSSVGWELSPDYPNQEATFFGNIFVTGAHGGDSSKVQAFYCNGRAYNVDTVAGRIGANQNGAPYTDPFLANGKGGYCADSCAPSDTPYPDSGFKACNGWNYTVTTYRQAATGGTIKATGTGAAAVLTATITKYAETLTGYCANIAIKNSGSAAVGSWTVTYDTGASNQMWGWFGAFAPVTGTVQTVKSGPATGSIPAGGTRTVGFCANGAGTPSIKSVTTP